MNINELTITVEQLTAGYSHSPDGKVTGYSGKLDIRPPFQREFIYSPEQQQAVINSIINGFPLNVMYWVKTGPDSFDMLDGQQRTLSICEYIDGNFSIHDKNIHSQPEDIRRKINDYQITIYVCEGGESEIMDWFKVINIAGEKLTKQEARNAVYKGSWVSDARYRFSRDKCEAEKIASDYMSGSAKRQDYLEAAIRWIADRDSIKGDDDPVSAYMSFHKDDINSNELWLYFKAVIDWVRLLFPVPANAMKGIEWGKYYNRYHNVKFDAQKIAERVKELQDDEDVTSSKGVYEYVLDGDERHLSIRKFPDRIKRRVYERQEHRCAKCGQEFELSRMEADHILAWSKGGHTVEDNCQLLCRKCNAVKSDK